jgi:hypothetical protein
MFQIPFVALSVGFTHAYTMLLETERERPAGEAVPRSFGTRLTPGFWRPISIVAVQGGDQGLSMIDDLRDAVSLGEIFSRCSRSMKKRRLKAGAPVALGSGSQWRLEPG